MTPEGALHPDPFTELWTTMGPETVLPATEQSIDDLLLLALPFRRKAVPPAQRPIRTYRKGKQPPETIPIFAADPEPLLTLSSAHNDYTELFRTATDQWDAIQESLAFLQFACLCAAHSEPPALLVENSSAMETHGTIFSFDESGRICGICGGTLIEGICLQCSDGHVH